jgi:hypothetical protein
MNLGANGGTFTGNFVNLQKNGVSQLTVDNAGSLTTNGNIFATGTLTVIGQSTLANATATNLTASTSLFITSFTTGSIPFAGAGGLISQNNANFFWDNTNTRLGIGSGTPIATLSVKGSGTTSPFIIASSTGAQMFNFTADGRLGIASSSPGASFTLNGAGGINPFIVASSTGSSLFTILQNGNIGIASSTPAAKLAITGDAGLPSFLIASSSGATIFLVDGTGRVAIGTTTLSASSSVKLTVAGDIRVGTSSAIAGCLQNFSGGTIAGTCSSDQNLKTGITDISGVLDRFQALRVVNYRWNSVAANLYGDNVDATNTGYIAQNVESLFPELVVTNQEGYKQVDYSAMGLYAVEGVKELSLSQSQASSTLGTLLSTVNSNHTEASSSISSLSSTIAANYLAASSTFSTVFGLISSNNSNLQSQISSITSKINTTNSPANAMTISSNGTVGIGNDGTQLGDEMLRVSGRVRATGFDIDGAADLAEKFEAVEAMDAGTVVAFSTSTVEWNAGKNDTQGTSTDDTYTMSKVRKAQSGYEAVGVVSTNPGIVLGKNVQNGVPVAFSGRIPVKVTSENGEIKQGDYLTVSATMSGYAMKLTGEGHAIGRALSDYVQGKDKVLMLVENTVQKLDLAGKNATTTGMLTTGNIDLNANGVAITNVKSLASANGTWSIDENGRIVAKQLCLDDLCIDKNTLTNLLHISGQTGVVLGASSSTQPGTSTSSPTETGTSTASTTPGTSTSTPTGTTGTSTSPTVTGTSTDTTAPVVTITGPTSVTVTVGGTFTDQGAVAVDDVDGDITSSIVVTGTVDTSTIGVYGVNYTATDKAGNVTTVARVVNVVAAP